MGMDSVIWNENGNCLWQRGEGMGIDSAAKFPHNTTVSVMSHDTQYV